MLVVLVEGPSLVAQRRKLMEKRKLESWKAGNSWKKHYSVAGNCSVYAI
jgi:hypothetical protein